MKKSIVYFIVILTMLSLSLTLVPSALSQQENIRILSYSYYIDSLGYIVIVGEVQNTGPNTIASVIVAGRIDSADGGQAFSSAQAWVTNLIPQQKAPFYMEFAPESTDGSQLSLDFTNVELQVAEAAETANYLYPDVTITDYSSTISDGVFWVSGTVKNTGGQTAKDIRIIGTFYNTSGAVVGVSHTDPLTPSSLSPSSTAKFKFGAFDLNQTLVPADQKIYDYSLLVQVEEPILQGTAPIISPTPRPSPATTASPGTTNSPSDTQPSNSNFQLPTWAYAIVVVIAVIAIAGTLLVLKKRKH